MHVCIMIYIILFKETNNLFNLTWEQRDYGLQVYNSWVADIGVLNVTICIFP